MSRQDPWSQALDYSADVLFVLNGRMHPNLSFPVASEANKLR